MSLSLVSIGGAEPKSHAKTGCVIGNSHIGAVKAGWGRLSEASQPFALDFFASKSQSLSTAFVQDGLLKSDDESVRKSLQRTGGAEHIDLTRYDLFVIVGCGLHFRICGRMLKFASLHPHARQSAPLVSRAALAEGVRLRLEATAAWKVARMITSVTDAPIYVLPEPFYDRQVLEADNKQFMRMLDDSALAAPFEKTFDAAAESVFAEFGAFVRQPEATRDGFIFTHPRFAISPVGSRYVSGDQKGDREGDYTHKNGDYGELMLASLLAAIENRDARAKNGRMARVG